MTKLNIGLESAYDTIVNDYDLQTLNEIVNHGCQSGVCSQHIYYGDTIQFYDTFETDILESLSDEFSTELLVDLFRDADADLTVYKNHVVWAFIEQVAFEAVEDYNHEYAMTVRFSHGGFNLLP